MRTYKVSLRDRLRRQERYATNPEHRLAVVNRNRRNRGLPPYASPEEIPDYTQLSSAAAAKRQRDNSGRFL